MINKKYVLMLRTSTVEMKSWDELYSHDKEKILPLIELTRGSFKRGAKNRLGEKYLDIDYRIEQENIFEIDKNIEYLQNIVSNQKSFVDITKNKTLQAFEINNIFVQNNEFEKWIDFLKKLGNDNNIIPVLQGGYLNFNEDNSKSHEYVGNYRKQFEFLSKKYTSLAYRFYIRNSSMIENYLIELSIIIKNIKDYLEKSDNQFYLIVDYGDIKLDIDYSFELLKKINIVEDFINNISNKIKIIILSNSYVKNDVEGPSKILEIELFKKIIQLYKNYDDLFIYGDYGSISKFRNDDIIMARGWIPKVEFAFDKSIYTIKQKRGDNDYETAYKIIGDRLKIEYLQEFNKIVDSWGKCILDELKQGKVIQKNPGFYISVRNNIFVTYIISILNDIYKL
jgi:hypothetical protein